MSAEMDGSDVSRLLGSLSLPGAPGTPYPMRMSILEQDLSGGDLRPLTAQRAKALRKAVRRKRRRLKAMQDYLDAVIRLQS
jgi:hypothetical protein